MKDYVTSMECWNSKKLQESVKRIKDLSTGTSVTVKEVSSQFQSIYKCNNKLQSMLREHTDSQESPITLMLPVLSKEDILSIFADDMLALVTFTNEGETSLDAKGPDPERKVTGIIGNYSYKLDDGSRIQIFDLDFISKLVAACVSITSEEENEDYKEIRAAVSLSLSTVVFSRMLAQQNLDHVANRLQLSSSAQEKVSTDEGFSRLGSLRKSLKRAEDSLKEFDHEDLNLPGTSQMLETKTKVCETIEDLKRQIKGAEKDNQTRELKLLERKSQVLVKVTSALKKVLDESLSSFGSIIGSTRGFFVDQLRNYKAIRPWQLRQIFDEALLCLHDNIRRQPDSFLKSSKAFKELTERLKKLKECEISQLSTEDPLHQAMSMICAIIQFGLLQMMLSFKQHFSRDQVMANGINHLRNRIEDQCQKLQECCLNKYFDQEGIQEQALELLRTIDSIEGLCEVYHDVNSVHETLHYAKLFLLNFAGVCCAHANAMHPLSWYLDTLLPQLKAAIEAGDIPILPPLNEMESAELIQSMTVTCKSLCCSLTTLPYVETVANPFEISWRMETYLHRNREMNRTVCFLARQSVSGMNDMTQRNEGQDSSKSIIYTSEGKNWIQTLSKVIKLDLNDMSISDLANELVELRKHCNAFSILARNAAKHSSRFIDGYLKPMSNALCHEIMSLSLSVKQRESLIEGEVLVKSKSDRMKEKKLLLVDFGDLNELREGLDQHSVTLQQLDYDEENISWLHMLASLLHQFHEEFGPSLVKAFKDLGNFEETTIKFEEFEICLDIAMKIMTLPVSTTLGLDPSIMRWMEKLNKRSSFVPGLQKSICCNLNDRFDGAQQNVKAKLEDLSKWVKMATDAADGYTVAAKKLTEARKQGRKGLGQRIMQGIKSAVHKKESLAPELHKIAIDIYQEFVKLWRCIDIRLQADVGAFWYSTDETALFLSNALEKVVENQKMLKQKGAITENLDLSEFGIQQRLISVTLVPELPPEFLVNSPAHCIHISCENGVEYSVGLPTGPYQTEVTRSPIQFFVEDLKRFQITITSFDQDQNPLKIKKLNLQKLSNTISFDLHESSSHAKQDIMLEVERSYLYVASSGSESDNVDIQSHWNLFEQMCQDYHKKVNDLQKVLDEVTESENALSEMNSRELTRASELLMIQEADHSKAMRDMHSFFSQDAASLTKNNQPIELAADMLDSKAMASHVVSVLKQINELFEKPVRLKVDESNLAVVHLLSQDKKRLLKIDLKNQWTHEMKDAFKSMKAVYEGTMDTLTEIEHSWLEFWQNGLLCRTVVSTNDKQIALLSSQQQAWFEYLQEIHLPSHVKTNWQEEAEFLFNHIATLSECRSKWYIPFQTAKYLIKSIEDLQPQSNEDGVLFGARMQDQNQLMISDREDGGCGLSSSSPMINFGVLLHPDDLHESSGRPIHFFEVINRSHRVMIIELGPEISDNECAKFELMAPKKVRLYGNTSHKFRMVANHNVIGKVQETWILRSDDVHLNEIFTVCVDVQRLGVQLDTDVIDFGYVIPGSNHERVIKLKSVTDLPLLVKSQLMLGQNTQRSDLQLSQECFKFLSRSSQDLTVSLEASHQPEKIDIDLMLAIVSSKNLKMIKVTGEVTRPQFSFKSPDEEPIRNKLELPPSKPGNRTVSQTTIENIGRVPVNFSFEHSHDDLEISPMNGSIPVKGILAVCFSARLSKCKSPSWPVIIRVEGIDDRSIHVSGRWIDPILTLSQNHIKFGVTAEAINKAKEAGDGFVLLEAKNKLKNKTEVEVKVYPPTSPVLEFCQEYYTIAPKQIKEFSVKWKTSRLIEDEQKIILLTESGKEIPLALSQSWKLEGLFRLNPFSIVIPHSFSPKESKEVELTFRSKNSIFIEEHKPESEVIESMELKEAPRYDYSFAGKSSRTSESTTGTREIKPGRNRADAKYMLNIKANRGSGWFIQDIITATDDNIIIRKDLFMSQEVKHEITMIAHISKESNAFARMLLKLPKQRLASENGVFCVPDIRILTNITAGHGFQAFLLTVLFQTEIFKKDWALDGELIDQMLACEPDHCIDMCAQHACNTFAPSSSSDETYKQAMEYFKNVRDLYVKDDVDSLRDICIPAFILRTKKDRARALAFAMYLLNNPELSESEQWKACIGCLVSTMSSVVQASEFRKLANELVNLHIDGENLYQFPSLSRDLELVKAKLLHDDEEHLVAFDFLETVIGDPSRLTDECLEVFENSILKFEKEWFAQLLTDPASFNPTKVALSFLMEKDKDRLEKLCSKDLTAVLIEFCKIAVSNRHQPDHVLSRHLLECVVTTSQQHRRQGNHEERVREWLMPILMPYEFDTLLQPLCKVFTLSQFNKDSKKQNLRILVLRLVSWAVNQSGDRRSTATWRDIAKAAEVLINKQTGYQSNRQSLFQSLHLYRISNGNKQKEVEKCFKDWFAMDPIQDVSLLVHPLVKAYEEITLPDPRTASSSAASEQERIKVDRIVDALKALGPGDLSCQTRLLISLGRVLVFVSYWDNSIEDLACSWLDFAEERNRDNVLPLFESIADTCNESGPLNNIIAALSQEVEHVDDTHCKIAKQICPEESFVALKTCVTSLIHIDVDIDNETKTAAEEICSSEGKEALSILTQFVKAKNAFTSVQDNEVSSLTRLMVSRDLMDAVCKITGWTVSKKKSVSALNVFFSYRAFNLLKNSTLEACSVAKTCLMVSILDFYQGKHWEQKEAIRKGEVYCLEWTKADISAIMDGYVPVEEEQSEDEVGAEDSESVADDVDNLPPPEWKWFLEGVDIHEDQLDSPGHENEDAEGFSSTNEDDQEQGTNVLDETQTSEFTDKISKIQDQLIDLETRIDFDGILNKIESGEDLPLLEFADIVKLAADLTLLSDTWSAAFRFALDHCNRAKTEEEMTLEFQVVQSGVKMLSLLEFLCEHLRHCSHFEIPTEVKEAHELIVHSLKLIPTSNLPKSYQTLLAKFDKREAEGLSTLKDFSMPSRVLRQEGTTMKGPSFPSERLNFSPLDDVQIEEISVPQLMTPTLLEQKLTTATATLANEEERNPTSVLNQKIKIDVSLKQNQPKLPTLSDEEDKGSSSSSNVEQNMENDEGFKLPSTLTCRITEGESQTVHRGDIENVFTDDFEAVTSGLDDEFSHKFEGDIKLSMDDKRQLLNASHLAKVYKDATVARADVEREEVADATKGIAVKHERWTYQLLVESKPLTKFLADVMQAFDGCFKEFYCQTTQPHRFEWCIMVDNSGSMLAKENQTMEALVLVMEMLKRLEHPFAVARFGNRKSQRILKPFGEYLTHEVGQRVLESFSHDEGTYPASGFANISEKLWPKSLRPEERRIHRIAFMIVDGLTQEREPADYISVREEKGIDLVVLNIKDEVQDELMSQIEALWKQSTTAYQVLDVSNINALSGLVAVLMIDEMRHILETIKSNTSNVIQPVPGALSSVTVLTDAHVVPVDQSMKLGEDKMSWLVKKYGNQALFTTSYQTVLIPFQEEMEQLEVTLSQIEVFNTDALFEAFEKSQSKLQTNLNKTDILKTANGVWKEATDNLSGDILRTTEALESLLPINVYTRKRPDVKGPSLHLQGFIKHLATQGNEKKIFANKKGGGRSAYGVFILLDTSASMKYGRREQYALETLVLMIESLQHMNIQNFGVACFGQEIYPIKMPESEWDDTAIAALLSKVSQGYEMASMDADALLFASEVLENSHSRGPKKIFVLTDGYGSSGLRLAAVLSKLSDMGIDVIAMGIGPEAFFVKDCYNKWITASLPHLLPDALTELSQKAQNTTAGLTEAVENQKESIDWLKTCLVSGTGAETVEEVLRNKEQFFPDLMNDWSNEREVMLQTGNRPTSFTVDICFALDCTGSMGPWIDATKQQIKFIATKIEESLKEHHPKIELELSFGVVAYRDYGDEEQHSICPLSSNLMPLLQFLDSQYANGGSDAPEDVLGALHAAATTVEWKGRVRFCVLIADCPGHGSDLNDYGGNDRYFNGDPNGLTSQQVMKELRDKDIHFMFCRITKETDKMIGCFEGHYNDNLKHELISKDIFGAEQNPYTGGFHFVFCLDESGSMAGRPWRDLEQAFARFLQLRENSQYTNDILSVVQFNTVARIVHQGNMLDTSVGLATQNTGGTEFCPALDNAQTILNSQAWTQSPILIFMSDGEAHDNHNDILSRVDNLKNSFQLQTHTVGFGCDAGHGLLSAMAEAGGGKHHRAVDGIQLSAVFADIATGTQAMESMVCKFGGVISDMVSSKIIIDHL